MYTILHHPTSKMMKPPPSNNRRLTCYNTPFLAYYTHTYRIYKYHTCYNIHISIYTPSLPSLSSPLHPPFTPISL